MAKSIKKLREDLTILETETRLVTNELYELSRYYLQRLNSVITQQLIFACYKICTSKYPEQFLILTYSEKVDLQEKIRAKGAVFLSQLNTALQEIDLPKGMFFANFPFSFTGLSSLQAPSTPDHMDNEAPSTSSEMDNLEVEKEAINPAEVIRFFAEIEDCVMETLKEISISTNNFLKEYKILPANIPNKILAMALENSDASNGVSDTPNLIGLIVEKEKIGTNEMKDITPIVAVCLRLSEIEFSDAELRTQRPPLLAIMDKLINLEKKYHRLDRLYKITLAESQWRSCWSHS